jgi:outer membrane protein assembly factor BamE
MKIKNLFVCVMCIFSLLGCSSIYNTLVYQVDVTQGNYIDENKLKEIEIGMTQEQVIFVLGSPMLIDQFDSSKWYYIRYIKPGGQEAQQSQIILTFEAKKLIEISSENTEQENPLIELPNDEDEPTVITQDIPNNLPTAP